MRIAPQRESVIRNRATARRFRAMYESTSVELADIEGVYEDGESDDLYVGDFDDDELLYEELDAEEFEVL